MICSPPSTDRDRAVIEYLNARANVLYQTSILIGLELTSTSNKLLCLHHLLTPHVNKKKACLFKTISRMLAETK